MSLHSIIEHRANYYFLKLEEDYVEICQGKHKHCKAAILSILENWMNSKRTETSRENDLYVYLSYPQFVKHMFGLYGRNTVIASLEELEQEGLILKRPFRDVFNQETFEYRLNCSVVQQRLSMLPDKSSTWGSLNLNGGSLEMDGGSFENKRGGSLLLNGGSFKSKRNIEPTIESIIEPTENTEREEVAIATAHSQSSQIVVDEQTIPVTYAECVAYLQQRGIALESDAVQVMVTARNLYVQQYPHATLPPLDTDETVKREAVKPSQKDTAHGTSAHAAPGSAVVGNAGTPASGRTERQDTNKVAHPPAPKKPPTNTIPKRPKQQPITTPVSPEAQRILDDWVSLFTKKIVINQGDIDAAEHLVPTNITCEEMRQERLWLFSTDNPQKPWYRKIGVCLADIDKKYSQWQSLNEAPKPPPGKDESNEHRATQQPANAFIERCLDKDYNKRKLEEMREKNALKRQAQAAKGV